MYNNIVHADLRTLMYGTVLYMRTLSSQPLQPCSSMLHACIGWQWLRSSSIDLET